MFALTSLILIGSAFAEPVPGDEDIAGAIQFEITPAGFGVMGNLVPELAPEALPVEDISEGYGGLFDQCWLGGAEVDITNLQVGVEFDSLTVTPQTGYLEVEVRIYVHVNSAADPFYMSTMLECIEQTCDVWLDPFAVEARTTMALDLVEDPSDTGMTGDMVLEATLGELSFEPALTGEDVSIENCTIGWIRDVLGIVGLDFIDLLVAPLTGLLDGSVAELGPELETAIEEAFLLASIEQSFDLQGVELNISARPGDIIMQPGGMRIALDGSAYTSSADRCISEWDDGTFEAVPSDPPAIGDPPAGAGEGYGGGLLISDEFGHQALYALWRSGLLCYTVDEDLGFPIDTSLLGLLAGDAFNELFPDSKPMVIVTRPKKPPVMNFASENDVGVKVEELGLDFMGELDHRMARVLALDLEVDAGIDLDFDGETGQLGIAIDLGSDSITPTVSSNDFAPESSETIETSFGSVFNGLVGGLLGDALGDLNFTVPGFEGLGLTDLQFSVAGAQGDWLGGYAWIGEVSYASSGCSEDGGGCADDGGGCGDLEGSGCDGGGCTAAPKNQRRWLWLLFPVLLISLRRRA